MPSINGFATTNVDNITIISNSEGKIQVKTEGLVDNITMGLTEGNLIEIKGGAVTGDLLNLTLPYKIANTALPYSNAVDTVFSGLSNDVRHTNGTTWTSLWTGTAKGTLEGIKFGVKGKLDNSHSSQYYQWRLLKNGTQIYIDSRNYASGWLVMSTIINGIVPGDDFEIQMNSLGGGTGAYANTTDRGILGETDLTLNSGNYF